MFYIQAMICFLQIQNFSMPVCFSHATIPYSFNSMEECILSRDELIELIDPDLKNRKVSMILYCAEQNKRGATNV